MVLSRTVVFIPQLLHHTALLRGGLSIKGIERGGGGGGSVTKREKCLESVVSLQNCHDDRATIVIEI